MIEIPTRDWLLFPQDRKGITGSFWLLIFKHNNLRLSMASTSCMLTFSHSSLSPQPPIVPKVSHEGDTSNFDVYPEDDWKKDPPVPQKDLELFKNF